MRKIFFTVWLLLMFVVTSCGAGDPVTEFKVDMVEFIFTPSEFTVPAGKEITITAANNGAIEHEFTIFRLGTTAGDEFGDEDLENVYWLVRVSPGDSTTTTFTAPAEPGEYYVACGIPGHIMAGMAGRLIVVQE